MQYDGPPLDLSALLAILEDRRDLAPPQGCLDRERLEALKTWRDALLHRAEVAQRIEQVKQAETAPATTGSPGGVSIAAPVVTLERLDTGSLGLARSVADIGSNVPDFSYHGKFKRLLARIVARPVLFLAGIVTAHQRVYNAELLEFTVRSSEQHNRLATAFEDFVARFRNTEEKLRNIEEELRGGLGVLRRQDLEQELRLADVESNRAWLELGEIEKRQRLAQLEDRLELEESRWADESAQGKLGQIGSRLQQLEEALAVVDPLEEARVRHRERLESLEAQLAQSAEVESRLDTLQEKTGALGRRLHELLQGKGPVPAASKGALASEFDDLYVRLEEKFRGPRELIRKRLEVYLPLFEENELGSPESPILDLGCGRGEWLELLSEHGYRARGVDLNETLVDQCRDRGLEVAHTEALEYLQGQRAAELGLVSAFHLLEHLPFGRLIALLDATIKALRPGGLALFESPNPENLLVASSTFHCDPTHQRPLHPELLQFLMKERGFVDLEVRRLKEYRLEPEITRLAEDHPMAATLNPLVDFYNQHFVVAPDFAILGRRPN